MYLDRISKQAALLQQHYRLSERETEVMELIARGNTVARIAEDLVVTENTIRTHSKRIYAKLAIPKKQELRPQRLAGIETLQCAEARFETLCLRSRATPIVVHRFSLRSTAVFV